MSYINFPSKKEVDERIKGQLLVMSYLLFIVSTIGICWVEYNHNKSISVCFGFLAGMVVAYIVK